MLLNLVHVPETAVLNLISYLKVLQLYMYLKVVVRYYLKYYLKVHVLESIWYRYLHVARYSYR